MSSHWFYQSKTLSRLTLTFQLVLSILWFVTEENIYIGCVVSQGYLLAKLMIFLEAWFSIV